MLPWTYQPNALTVFNKSLSAFAENAVLRACKIAHRYYDGTAYMGSGMGTTNYAPLAFGQWDETKYGSRPPCSPLPKRCTEIAAQFLFGDTPHIQVGDPDDDSEDSLQKFFDDVVCRPNAFYEGLIDEARACSIEGATEYKWAWQPETDKKRPVLIQTYHPYDVTYIRDDLNPEVIDLVRIQFKYVDRSGQWWWYREEWTKQHYTVFRKLPTTENDDTVIMQMMQDREWPAEFTKSHPLGIIPIQKVYNRKRKGLYEGIGDYWEPNLYKLLDIYNHKVWFEHFSDQVHSNPSVVFVDLEYEGVLIPGQVINARSLGEHPAIEQVKTDNPAREYMTTAKAEVCRDWWNGVGYDDVDQSVITNKGNLTQAVLKLTFAKTVDSTKTKRVYWGLGLECFFEEMMEGLSQLPDALRLYPALKKVKLDDPTTYDVTVNWPDDFDYSPEEVQAILTNLGLAVTSGFLTQERATAMAAKSFRITDISELIDELKDVHEDMDTMRQASVEQATNEAKAIGQKPGGG